MNTMTITPIPILKDNYVWVLSELLQRSVWIVDPGDAAPVSHFLRQHQWQLAGILVTHHHWDHTNGVLTLANAHHVPVYGPATENIPGMTHPLQDNDTVTLTSFQHSLKVMAIPGHTLGHIAYYAQGMLFCGDTLFAAGCGRLFEGVAIQLFTSLEKIAALPDETHIYCAHEYTLDNLRFAKIVEPGNHDIAERLLLVEDLRQRHLPSLPSLLKEEKKTNPFLRCHSPELIANVERFANRALHGPLEVFTWLRKWKDEF